MTAARLIAAAASFIGGGILNFIMLGLLVSALDLSFTTIWQGALIGAFVWGVIGFFSPKLGMKLIEFVG